VEVVASAWSVRLASRSDVVADERRWEREHLARNDRYYVLPPEKDAKQLQREAAEARKRQRDNKVCGCGGGGGRACFACLFFSPS
jgi:hypothetical protein